MLRTGGKHGFGRKKVITESMFSCGNSERNGYYSSLLRAVAVLSLLVLAILTGMVFIVQGSFRWGLGGLGDGDGRVGSEVNRLRQGARVAPPLSAAPALRRPAPELGAPWRGRSTGGENLLVNSALRYGLQGPDKAAGGGAAADATIHWQAASSMLDLLVAGMALPADFFFFIWLGVFLFKPCYTLVQ
jgi:hypothetical protein